MDPFAQNNLMRISQTVENASSHVIDDTSELDVVAVLAEIGTAFVPGIGRPPARRAYGSERL